MKAALLLLLSLSPALHAQERKYAWDENWPRFRKSEYLVTGLALGGSAANFYLVDPPKSSSWRGQILFDKSARNTLLIHTEAGRNRAANISDLMTFGLIGYAAADGPITSGLFGKNWDTAAQLGLINIETFAVTEVLNLGVSNLIARRRPTGAECDPRTQYDPYCVKSFWSGHAANAFAAASLVCVEHGALDLYGGKADGLVCGASLAAAAGVGVLRIAGNDHHASDVVAGAVVGAATGYLMPKLLHFRSKRSPNHLGYLVPRLGPGGGGLTYVKDW